MKRNVDLRINNILESMDLIERYIHCKSKVDFYENVGLQDSVLRRLEIIGEATKHIPTALRSKYPEIPWRKMAGLRDVVIHDYAGLMMGRVWKTITKDLPSTKPKIEEIKKLPSKKP